MNEFRQILGSLSLRMGLPLLRALTLRLLAALALGLPLVLSTGCGQKGPLQMPAAPTSSHP